ncbi:neogenin-like [Pomacea canaliculata]|uniref:neogenin-like n=1 Tax=Pomacea canaliculata TaxID=400727 RepID=UPI000D7366BD|nr:neogenin-like [Pomacea canaliculata]
MIPLPPSIQNVRALALSPDTVSVIWDDPIDYNYTITNYQVEFREDHIANAQVRDTRSKKIELSSLRPNQTYAISVRAGNSYGFGDASPEIKVQTLTNEGLQPANVSAVALNSSIIQLDWESPKNIDRIYILGYNIYYKRESDTQEEMLFIEGNRNKQFLIGMSMVLGRDETYYLRIATLTTWGYEAPSEWIRIQKHPQELLPPVPPRDVKAVTMLESVRVTWQSSSEPDTRKSPLLGYHIVYGPADDPSEINRVDLGANAVQFAIRGLKPSTKYIISIRAFNKYSMSDPVYVRAETKALPPSTVINATAVALSPTEIHVHWETPTRGHVTKYQLRYWRPGKRDKQSAWLKAPTTDYVAGSLMKFSSYRFEIIPYSGDVIGEGSVIFADTLSSRPDTPPRKVQARPLNSTHLVVTWEEPSEHTKNGVVTGYKIIMKMKKGPRLAKFGVDGGRRNYTFKNLEPGETYKIRIAATNINGTGPFTDWVVARTEEITMRQPQNPENLHVNVSAYAITLSWSPPNNIGVPVLGYIVGHGRYIPEVYRSILGPSVREFTITDLKPDTEYIVSIRAFNHIGESVPEYTLVQTSKAPEMLELEVPVKLKVIPLSPNIMEVSWLDPARQGDTPVSDGRHYFIRYSAISGETYHYVNVTSTSINVTDLQAATVYEFAVRTIRGEEQSRWSLPVVNTTQQTAPTSSPGNRDGHITTWFPELFDPELDRTRITQWKNIRIHCVLHI